MLVVYRVETDSARAATILRLISVASIADRAHATPAQSFPQYTRCHSRLVKTLWQMGQV
jgi:hypothetical protein